MNMSADNIVVNSCQYTPVYFIENPGVNQARSYVLEPNNQSVEKPVSESLKRFYENSGNLESNLTTTDQTKPKIIKKNDTSVVGNNLKLASFLLPKCETKTEISPAKPIITPVNSVVLKPVYIANNLSVNNVNSQNQVPKLDVNSRLVKLKDLPNIVRTQNGKILPKIKPKENSLSSKPIPTAVQAVQPVQTVQPVQLVKFGETYHSLNQLSNDQMKIVNQALKMLNTQGKPPERAYDPTTNTKFIYKVISQKDLVEQNKVAKLISTDNIKKEPVELEIADNVEEEEQKVIIEAKVTRSGRVVKLPKNIIVDDSPSKPKKRSTSILTCMQCNSKFSSPQRLHRHFESYPTHMPSNLHNNLFHCLVAMVSACSEHDRANIMLQQLQMLVDRLQACAPCLLTKGDSAENICEVSNEMSKLFRINPGMYNMNMEALNCVKDKDGYCSHNPRPQINVGDNIKSHFCLENTITKAPSNILKINFQERRPTILRKVECRKQKLEQSSPNVNGKKIKLSQDISTDKNSSKLELNELVALYNNISDKTKTDNKDSKGIDKIELNNQKDVKLDTVSAKVETMTKPSHIKFHSAHFDIRSSPIKPSSTVFRKFQINPEKMTKYIEIIRPIKLNQLAQDVEMTNNEDTNKNAQVSYSPSNIITKESENLNYTAKTWCADTPSCIKQNGNIISHIDNFIKPDTVIQPALLHVGTGGNNLLHNNSNSGKNSEVANENIMLQSLLDSNIYKICNQDSKINKGLNNTDFTKPSILIEPLVFGRSHDHTESDKASSDPDNDFLKSDILLDQALINNQDCKVIDEITNRTDDFISNILNEQPLSADGKMSKFEEHTASFMDSNTFIDQLPQNDEDSENRLMTSVTESNITDVESNSSQGQSIISFLESLGNELAYNDSETDSRNNVDFQLDLFSFNNS